MKRFVTWCCWLLAVGATLLVGLQAPVALAAGSCIVETWELLRLVSHAATLQLAFSPDSRRIAVATSIGVELWNEDQGQVERVLTGPANSVAWSPDGTRRIASGFGGGTIKVWDADSGALLRFLPGTAGSGSSVAWSPDSTRIATGDFDLDPVFEILVPGIRVWDWESGTPVRFLPGAMGSVGFVAWSPDGTRISGADARSIKVWDANSGALRRTLTGHTDSVTSVAWSPDSTRIASSSADRSVKVWDPDSGALLLTLTGHTDVVTSVAWSPDGTRIASGSWDPSIKVWD